MTQFENEDIFSFLTTDNNDTNNSDTKSGTQDNVKEISEENRNIDSTETSDNSADLSFSEFNPSSSPQTTRKTRKSSGTTKAEKMAAKQREISISEFFAKNKQLLGFDSPKKALLTTIKEAVDNSLDACEEAGILPTILVEIKQLKDNRYIIIIQDNGPGIVKEQIPKIFGQLLYGSKFHTLKQSRGQQGIGISAAGMYAQMTTGKAVKITSRISKEHPAHHFEILMDLQKNRPNIIKDIIVDWDEEHGTRVELELVGAYKSGKHSIEEYLSQTAIANPHAEIHFININEEKTVYPRVAFELPREALEIRPHPYGVEFGMFMKIIRESPYRKLASALQHEFSRVTPKIAKEVCAITELSPTAYTAKLKIEDLERLHKAINSVKIMSPPATAVVPIGEKLLKKGLARQIKGAEFYVSKTRPPKVYRGNPFDVEVGLAYGGELQGLNEYEEYGTYSIAGVKLEEEKTLASSLLNLPGFTRKKANELIEISGLSPRVRIKNLSDDDIENLRINYFNYVKKEATSSPARIIRLANRVPLLYQEKACAISKAIMDINWKRYGVSQPKGGFPVGPLVITVHLASVWVPFTSESKEAVAHYPDIIEEIKRGLQDCARELGTYLSRKTKMKAAKERKSVFKRYSGELARALAMITDQDKEEIEKLIREATEHFAQLPDLQSKALVLEEENKKADKTDENNKDSIQNNKE